MVPTAELANYVIAHSEFSAPMSRRNLLSALVASESANEAGTGETRDESDNANAVEVPRPNVDVSK